MNGRIFLLSPASATGKRAAQLLNPNAAFDLAVRLRTDGVTLGEAFAFLSGLYFRGKLSYARAFAGDRDAIRFHRASGALEHDVPHGPAET